VLVPRGSFCLRSQIQAERSKGIIGLLFISALDHHSSKCRNLLPAHARPFSFVSKVTLPICLEKISRRESPQTYLRVACECRSAFAPNIHFNFLLARLHCFPRRHKHDGFGEVHCGFSASSS
jgi:hypothetical protein